MPWLRVIKAGLAAALCCQGSGLALGQAQPSQSPMSVEVPVPEGTAPGEVVTELLELGYMPVELGEVDGVPVVLVGRFLDERVALQAVADLRVEGYPDARLPGGPAPWMRWAGIGGGSLLLAALGWTAMRASSRRVPHSVVQEVPRPAPSAPLAPLTPVRAAQLTPPPLVPTPEEARRRRHAMIPRAPIPLFADDFEQTPPGEPPDGWCLPEAGIASLAVAELEDRDSVLEYRKEKIGLGGLCWCSLPRCQGAITMEMDLVCHSKNNYLLGLYLQEGQDFRRAIPIQFQAGHAGSGRLCLPGLEASLPFGAWARLTLHIDLEERTLAAAVNGERLGVPATLINAPEHIDTLVIRTAPETVGHLGLARLRVWSASEASVVMRES